MTTEFLFFVRFEVAHPDGLSPDEAAVALRIIDLLKEDSQRAQPEDFYIADTTINLATAHKDR